MQKKQARVDNASPKPDTDSVKSPSNQKAEKKSKTVMRSLCYFTKVPVFKIRSLVSGALNGKHWNHVLCHSNRDMA